MRLRPARIASNIIPKKLVELRDRYCIPHSIEMLVPDAYKRACFLRSGCLAASEYLFKTAMCLSLYFYFRVVIRNFMLALTHVLPNG